MIVGGVMGVDMLFKGPFSRMKKVEFQAFSQR